MSRVEIYAVRPNGDIEQYGEVHNSWGGAMFIWVKLKDAYRIRGSITEGFTKLWASIGKMTIRDQWVLASTFDHVIIPKESLPIVIEHLNTFIEEYPGSETLPGEIEILEHAASDPDVQGICFNQTSVNTNPWYIYNEESGEERVYNVNADKGHWFLTAESLAHLNRG